MSTDSKKFNKTRQEMKNRVSKILEQDEELRQLLKRAGRRNNPGIQTFYRVCTMLLEDEETRTALKNAIKLLIEKRQ